MIENKKNVVEFELRNMVAIYTHIKHIKCVLFNVTFMVKLQDRVCTPWGPLSISAVAELV